MAPTMSMLRMVVIMVDSFGVRSTAADEWGWFWCGRLA